LKINFDSVDRKKAALKEAGKYQAEGSGRKNKICLKNF
jgi:hypothetical protein